MPVQQYLQQAENSIQKGTLYVLATPIGNLTDISLRALAVLKKADLVCAEDTRVTGQLLAAYNIKSKLISVRQHNERQMIDKIAEALGQNQVVVQVSDAGTPAICDPGAKLAQAIRAAGFKVSPIPGASAPIAALSVAGMESASFYFAGFLSSKAGERQSLIQKWLKSEYTVVCFEAPHRIEATLKDLFNILGERRLVMAREISKTFETIIDGTIEEVLEKVQQDSNQTRGEIVLILDAEVKEKDEELPEEARRIIEILANELPTKQAANLASQITGANKKALYDFVLKSKKSTD